MHPSLGRLLTAFTRVARNFVARVQERAVGQEVLSSLTPGQQIVKIVNEELTALLGSSEAALTNLLTTRRLMLR